MYVAIETEQLAKRALEGTTFHVEEGEIVAFLAGPGGGKTTLVQILTGRARPDAGWARVAGLDVVERQKEVRARTGVTLAEAALDATTTGRRYLELVGALWGIPRPAAHARADDLIGLFRLTDVADVRVGLYPTALSRRLRLAAALVRAPEVLVVDEPTAGLEPEGRRAVWEELWRSRAAGTTILLATGDAEEARISADRLVTAPHDAMEQIRQPEAAA
jgi:ABC-2 type transport system ATP-binding protein